MKKDLIETIDVTIMNVCKWADKNFVEKKMSQRDLLRDLDTIDDKKFNEQDFTKKIQIINSLSELLKSRAAIEESISKENSDDSKTVVLNLK